MDETFDVLSILHHRPYKRRGDSTEFRRSWDEYGTDSWVYDSVWFGEDEFIFEIQCVSDASEHNSNSVLLTKVDKETFCISYFYIWWDMFDGL